MGTGFFSDPSALRPAALLKKLFESKSLLRRYSYAEPWNWFVPDFETNVITPPPECPYSALNPLVSTVNSVMASTEGEFDDTQLLLSAREVFVDTPSRVVP